MQSSLIKGYQCGAEIQNVIGNLYIGVRLGKRIDRFHFNVVNVRGYGNGYALFRAATIARRLLRRAARHFVIV